MKTLLLILLLVPMMSFGQAPESFNYQAVVRDAGGLILNNQSVGLKLTIQLGSIGGPAVYTETFASTTNDYGIVNLQIGTGTSTDDFTIIDWANGPFFMETAVDVSGGTNYSVMGTSQLMSVPYALYAKTSGNGEGPAGTDGVDGQDGIDGAQGPEGPQGATGNNGINGAPGLQGPIGPAGDDGIDGDDGIQGLTGSNGPQGPAGTNGIDGIDGDDGPAGATGAQGPTGLTGAAGSDGNDGAVGVTGPQGPAGANGLDSITIDNMISQQISVNVDNSESLYTESLACSYTTIAASDTVSLPYIPGRALFISSGSLPNYSQTGNPVRIKIIDENGNPILYKVLGNSHHSQYKTSNVSVSLLGNGGNAYAWYVDIISKNINQINIYAEFQTTTSLCCQWTFTIKY